MKNKKGFTLVELMAVIVILGILIAIGIPIYHKVQKNIINKNYENIVSLIEQAAAKYASDTNITTLYVDNLIKDGYLEADDNKGFIYDPREGNEIMNCYLIQINETSGIYYPQLIQKDHSDSEGNCSMELLNELNNSIKINLYKKNSNTFISESESKSWSNEDVILKAWISDKYKNRVKKIEWIFENENKASDSNFNADDYLHWNNISSKYKTIEVKAENNTSLSKIVKLKIMVNVDNNDILLETSAIVKIDKVKPIFLDNSKWLPSENEWAPFKYYTFVPYDSDSNYKDYAYINLTESCNSAIYKEGNELKINEIADENGISKKICIRDYAGNIGEKVILIKKIDSNTPDCNITVLGTAGNIVNNQQWYIKNNVSIKLTAKAGISGVSVGITDKQSAKNKTYNSATNGNEAESYIILNKNTSPTVYYGIVKTGAGLVKNCTKTVALEKNIPNMDSDVELTSSDLDGYERVIASFKVLDKPISGIASVSCSVSDNNQNLLASTSSTNLNTCETGSDIPYYSTLDYSAINYIYLNNTITASGKIVSKAGNIAEKKDYAYQKHVCSSVESDNVCTGTNGSCDSGYGQYLSKDYSTINGQECPKTDEFGCSTDCYIDTSKPTISITLPKRETYKKSQKATVNIKYSSGIESYYLKWSSSNNTTDSGFKTKINANKNKSVSKVATYKDKTGTFYLCVKAIGTNGNKKIKCSKSFNLDNTAPTISCKNHSNGLSNSICKKQGLVYYEQCDYKDEHSKLNYSKSTWGGADDRAVNFGNNNSGNVDFNGSLNGTDTLCSRSSSGNYSVKICDNAGNCATKSGNW